MKILVTGGAGFLGSHLCRRLLELDYEVKCIDNLFTGKLTNISDLMDNPKFSFLNFDIKLPIVEDVEHFDQIYHLASIASPVHYQRASLETMMTNIVGSINMLELAKKCKSRILLTSTSEVYGDAQVSPQHENYWGNVNCVGPRACYDESKRCAETLFYEYNSVKNVDIRICRIFNTYGPNLDRADGRVVSNFITQALCGDPITVYGDGSQTRSLCYVSDLVDGLIKLMNSNEYVGPINLGNPHELTVKELAETIISLTNSKSEICYKPLPQDDPTNRRPDISKAKLYLDWEPKIGLNEGLTKTINYFS